VVIDAEFPEEMLSSVSLEDGTKLIRAAAKTLIEGSEHSRSEVDAGEIDRNSLAFIQHSAGTTGLQKGVALSHGAVLRQLEHLARS